MPICPNCGKVDHHLEAQFCTRCGTQTVEKIQISLSKFPRELLEQAFREIKANEGQKKRSTKKKPR